MPLKHDKDLKLYYSISEVAAMFNVNETLLRFWEKEFPQQITPEKGSRGVRRYTKEDIEKVRLVYNLVRVRGLKIAAAREALIKNHEGTVRTTEVVDRLRNIRAQLVEIKKEMAGME